jgi:hypothetical protein
MLMLFYSPTLSHSLISVSLSDQKSKEESGVLEWVYLLPKITLPIHGSFPSYSEET